MLLPMPSKKPAVHVLKQNHWLKQPIYHLKHDEDQIDDDIQERLEEYHNSDEQSAQEAAREITT